MAASRIQFGRHLECPVCTETYSPQEHVPKMLPCGHTFCNICLENVASDRQIECPKCKANHKVPRQGVQGISTNHDILGILFYFIEYVLSALIPITQCILGFALDNVHNNNSKHIIFGSYILGMVDYSCEECLRYGQTSRCTHCKKMVCSSCRESHKGDLQKSVIDSITGLQQMSSSLSAEWSVVNNKITAIISQCDIFCSTSKKNLRKSLSFDDLESAGEHVSECGKKLQQIQKIIRQLPSDIPDMDLAGLSITTGETTSAPVVSTYSCDGAVVRMQDPQA